MNIALDTNVLAYAEGIDDPLRRDAALETIMRLPQDRIVLPVQVLGELYNALLRKGSCTRAQARDRLLRWSRAYPVLDTTESGMGMAADLSAEHNLQIWDAVILCASSQAGCRLLLSDDMQDGFAWGGVTVVNPFAARPHPLLAALLKR